MSSTIMTMIWAEVWTWRKTAPGGLKTIPSRHSGRTFGDAWAEMKRPQRRAIARAMRPAWKTTRVGGYEEWVHGDVRLWNDTGLIISVMPDGDTFRGPGYPA